MTPTQRRAKLSTICQFFNQPSDAAMLSDSEIMTIWHILDQAESRAFKAIMEVE